MNCLLSRTNRERKHLSEKTISLPLNSSLLFVFSSRTLFSGSRVFAYGVHGLIRFFIVRILQEFYFFQKTDGKELLGIKQGRFFKKNKGGQ